MFKKILIVLFAAVLLVAAATTASANDPGDPEYYPWNHHQPPFDFKFGAMIDSHQQSRLTAAGILQGFIYIQRTGEFTAGGVPIAEKAHCSTGTCSLGWVIKGTPITATLVNSAPRVWLVDPADLPAEPGYNHFQWFGPPKTPHELVVGVEYEGYLLKRIAPEPFFWLGGSGGPGGSGGCGGHDGTDGGCTGHTDTGGTDHTDGSCSGHTGGGSPGGMGGGHGRLVEEGIDPHANIVTVWDGTWSGGCGGCSGHDGGCDGH